MGYPVPKLVVDGVRNRDFAQNDRGDGIAHVMEDSTTRPVASAAEIKLRFVVFSDSHESYKWWTKMMRNASDNGLKECRFGAGRKGLGGGSLWHPDCVAGWLVDRKKKGREGMSIQDARAALKRFPGCADIAEERFPDEG